MDDIPIYRADDIPVTPGMSVELFRTKEWLWLREARLRFDQHICSVPDCGARATIVDHIVLPRRAAGYDTVWNLRSLCHVHGSEPVRMG